MNTHHFSRQDLVDRARLSAEDLKRVRACRYQHTRLGFAYQLGFVRLHQRLPLQEPLEVVDELLMYTSMQLNIPDSAIEQYLQQPRTIITHQQAICDYLGLRRLGETEVTLLESFLFEEACRLEQTGPLLVQAKAFLKENGILYPANSTLRRLIGAQRQAARDHIYNRIADDLGTDLREKLDALLTAGSTRLTLFNSLKRPPRQPSPRSMLRLAEKLQPIQESGVLELDLSWLNNNYQRPLARYAHRCSADRMRALKEERRYATLVCFLRQVYQDTIDHMVDMHGKLMLKVENRAQVDVDAEMRRQRRLIRNSLHSFHKLGYIVLDDTVAGRSSKR